MGCMSPLGEYIVCPRCGYDSSAPYDKEYRAPGAVLGGRYILGRLARKNGESAVYIGYDNSVKSRVWIREYFPRSIARRDPLSGDVLPLEGHGAQYKALMSDFVDICNEVKRMGVTEPVIPIENVLGDHGTVCAVYKDMNVVPLETWLAGQGGRLTAAEARDLLLPLFNTLSNIHARGVIHRGISPYTVYIGENGGLYLWDFCMSATRTAGSELEAELFNGYSAPEQYMVSGWQGTWTDVYGAAALFYRVVSGFVPPKSTLIGDQRPLAPLIDLVMDLPRNISDAVSEAMSPVAEARTQEIGAFVSQLVRTNLSSTAVYDVGKLNEVRQTRERKRAERAEKRRRGTYVALGLVVTVALLIAVLYLVMRTWFPELVSPGSETSSRPGSSQSVSAPEENEADPGESAPPETVDKSMPSLIGQTADSVTSDPAYTNGRFLFSVTEDYNSQYPAGTIYDQSPPAGSVVQDGRTVILYVSKGKKLFIMPDLTGMTREEVSHALAVLNEGEDDLAFSEFTRLVPGAEPDTVISTTPPAGTEFDPKSATIIIFYAQESTVSEASRVEAQSDASGSPDSSQGGSGRMTVDEFNRRWNG